MSTKESPTGLTRKKIAEATGCRPYLVSYYADCGYLPIVKASSGPGDPTLFHEDAILIIKERIARKEPQK